MAAKADGSSPWRWRWHWTLRHPSSVDDIPVIPALPEPRHSLVMLGSGGGRWAVVTLLALLAVADGIAQYALAATPLWRALHLSDRQLRFLKVITGLCHCLFPDT